MKAGLLAGDTLPVTHLEVAKVLFPELDLLLAALDVPAAEVAGQCLEGLQGALVGRHVEVQLVALPIVPDVLLDAVASALGLPDTPLSLQNRNPSFTKSSRNASGAIATDISLMYGAGVFDTMKLALPLRPFDLPKDVDRERSKLQRILSFTLHLNDL